MLDSSFELFLLTCQCDTLEILKGLERVLCLFDSCRTPWDIVRHSPFPSALFIIPYFTLQPEFPAPPVALVDCTKEILSRVLLGLRVLFCLLPLPFED
ncbi:unnamed protein product [Soboliphyme baturini]|uniref:Secreted protein n=1 Tax=Soboliphyme baturini TaxID=241478 RepID=A0A183IJ66_9BILA|nr:unnamed protein product [Soboliphyme baturini]